MASRTSTSTGAWITIILLAIGFIGLVVANIATFAQLNTARKSAAEAGAQMASILPPEQRDSPRVQRAQDAARSAGTSLVDHLLTERREALRLAIDSPDAGLEDLKRVLSTEPRLDPDESMITSFRALRRELEREKERGASITAERDAALRDATNEAARVAAIERQYNDRFQELSEQVDQLAAERQDLTRRVEASEQAMDLRVRDTQAQASRREADLKSTITEQSERLLVLQRQVEQLRNETQASRLRPQEEAALVDARVITVNPASGEAFISIGRKQNVVLGLTFAVYTDASAIRPGPTGEYPPGKAVLEVVGLDDVSARCRILVQSRGNPVIAGDVVANAVYDPNKTYRFLVFGLFDTNRDGVASREEADQLRTLITSWGGQVVTDMDGAIDFLVLGTKPPVPPQPDPLAPVGVIEVWLDRQQEALRYDDFFNQAVRAYIPILNENRLRTLIGDFPG